VVDGITAGKAYVDMSTVDEATSQQIATAVTAKGGRFLEVWLEVQRMRAEAQPAMLRVAQQILTSSMLAFSVELFTSITLSSVRSCCSAEAEK
jgi:hypothetical protein